MVKNLPAKTGDTRDECSISVHVCVPSPSRGHEDPLEKETVAHSSILAWEIPWTEQPGRLQFMGLQSQIQLNTHTYIKTK